MLCDLKASPRRMFFPLSGFVCSVVFRRGLQKTFQVVPQGFFRFAVRTSGQSGPQVVAWPLERCGLNSGRE